MSKLNICFAAFSFVFLAPAKTSCDKVDESRQFKKLHAPLFLRAWKMEQKLEPVTVDIDLIIRSITNRNIWIVHLTHYKNINLLPIKQPIMLRSLFPVDIRQNMGESVNSEGEGM